MSGAPAPSSYETTAAYYDLFVPPERVAAIQGHLERLLGGEPGAAPPKVVDIGAGTGRLAVALATRVGAEVHCIEPSRAMRAGLLARALEQPLARERISIWPSAPAALRAASPAALIYMSGVLQHLEPAERRQLFGQVREALRPGGLFVLDIVVGAPTAAEQEVPMRGLGALRYRATFREEPLDADHARWTFRFRTYHAEALIEEEAVSAIRVVPRAGDLLEELRHAGLEVCSASSDWGGPPCPSEQAALFECRRSGHGV